MQRVVDFGYPDKPDTVLAGDVSACHFLANQNDQARLWAAGQRTSWWFNPMEVNAVVQAVLVP